MSAVTRMTIASVVAPRRAPELRHHVAAPIAAITETVASTNAIESAH